MPAILQPYSNPRRRVFTNETPTGCDDAYLWVYGPSSSTRSDPLVRGRYVAISSLEWFGVCEILEWFEWFGMCQILVWFGVCDVLEWFGVCEILMWFGVCESLDWSE